LVMCQGCHDASKIQNKKEKPRKTEQENLSPSEPSTLMRIVEQPIGMCSCQDAKFNFAATLSSVSKENTWPQMQFRTDSEHKKSMKRKKRACTKAVQEIARNVHFGELPCKEFNLLTVSLSPSHASINPPYSWEIHQEFLRSSPTSLLTPSRPSGICSKLLEEITILPSPCMLVYYRSACIEHSTASDQHRYYVYIYIISILYDYIYTCVCVMHRYTMSNDIKCRYV